MDTIDLGTLVQEQRELARQSSSGRAGHNLIGDRGHHMKQTLIVLSAGNEMQDHESPGEATLQVLDGEIEFHTDTESVTVGAGTLMAIPRERHGLKALQDSAIILTVVKAVSHVESS